MRKIFLVDDDSEILYILKEFFTEHDIEVDMNQTGHHVVEDVLRFAPDAIILDVNLPKKNGFDILKEIRQNALTAFLPVIMLTGNNDADSKIEGLTAGADDYVTKPFDLNVLYARVLNLFKKNNSSTRKKYDQVNLLNHLKSVYARRKYEVFSRFLNNLDDHPKGWQGFVPDMIILKKNKLRAFSIETAQSIIEEDFLKRLEALSTLQYKNKPVDSSIIVRSKTVYKKCITILKENHIKLAVKIIKKRKK